VFIRSTLTCSQAGAKRDATATDVPPTITCPFSEMLRKPLELSATTKVDNSRLSLQGRSLKGCEGSLYAYRNIDFGYCWLNFTRRSSKRHHQQAGGSKSRQILPIGGEESHTSERPNRCTISADPLPERTYLVYYVLIHPRPLADCLDGSRTRVWLELAARQDTNRCAMCHLTVSNA